MKVLGWLAVVITVLSVLVGISPFLVAMQSQGGDEASAGWVFLFASIPLAAIGLLIAAILAIIASSMALRRGAGVSALVGLIGIIGSFLLGIVAPFLGGSSGSGTSAMAWILLAALLAYVAGLVGTVWSGFAAKPRASAAG